MANEKIVKELESVKLDKYWIDKVRVEKMRTGVSIARFVEDSIREKLERVKRVDWDVISDKSGEGLRDDK